jgi:hypothetical protein
MGAQQRAPEALWPGGAGQTCSSREAIAALATASGEDRAAGTRTHPQAETVGLVPPTVVRLEGSLAHESSPKAGAALGRPIRREDHRRSPRRLPWAMTAPGRTSPRYARPAEGVKPADPPGGTRLPRSGTKACGRHVAGPGRAGLRSDSERHGGAVILVHRLWTTLWTSVWTGTRPTRPTARGEVAHPRACCCPSSHSEETL